MRKYIILFFLGSMFLIACNGNKPPAGILEHDPMVSLLTDIHIVDGRTYRLDQNQDSLYKNATGRYMLLFKQHHTDSLQFRKSLKYYSANPDVLTAIYDDVMVNLKKKTDSLNNKQYNKGNGIPHK